MSDYFRIEGLSVYRKLCKLHIEVCDLSHQWPSEEKYELGGQVRRASNSAPAQLAEKQSDRHVKNRIEGVNRSRGEAAETIHHLFMAQLKGYISQETYAEFHDRYQECVRMLNGMERKLEKQLPPSERLWPQTDQAAGSGSQEQLPADAAESSGPLENDTIPYTPPDP